MKRLYVMRHSTTIEKIPSNRDFERYLLPEGMFRTQQQANKFLALQLPKPDLIKSSPAWRAAQTATIFAAAMQQKVPLELIPCCYNACADTLLEVVNQTVDDVSSLLVVAHNFGISDFVNKLVNDDVVLAPAAIVAIEFAVNSWQDVHFNIGKKIAYAP